MNKHIVPLQDFWKTNWNINRKINKKIKKWKTRLILGFLTSGAIATLPNPGLAQQIVPDNTLGSESSVVNRNGNVRGLPASLIESGAIRGSNLFHSFSKFNVGDGQRVYFSNPTGIENILSRITGGDPSKIFGTLGVDGKANLFFINPNGILFGPNARLDVAGSFFASTADSFVFENGLQFSATNPEAAPLLTVSIRPGLQIGGNESGTITSKGNLKAGQDLTLSGVKLDLEGRLEAGKDLTLRATDSIKIRDSVVNPFIASANGNLLVQGNQSVDIFALNNSNSGLFSGGDMLLRSASNVGGDAHYWAGGNFSIEKLDGSSGNLFSPYDPVIRTRGDVSFASYEGTSLHILAGGSVNITGTVNITGAGSNTDLAEGSVLAETVTLSDETIVRINGATEPTLDIRAGTTDFGAPGLSPDPIPGISPPGAPNPNAPATSADININQIRMLALNADDSPIKGKILLTNQYKANNLDGDINVEFTDLNPDGVNINPDNVAMDVNADVNIDSRGAINTIGTIDVSGGIDSGNDTRLIAGNGITIGGELRANVNVNDDETRLTEDPFAGDISIKAVDDIEINSNIIASSNNDSTANFTEVTIESTQGSVFVNNSTLDTSNLGPGFAGNISITAREKVSIVGSTVESEGNQGLIYIGESFYTDFSPKNLIINDSGLNTNSSGSISTENGNMDSQNAGGIFITADSLDVLNGGRIEANSSGEGDAGTVTINATEGERSVTFDGSGSGAFSQVRNDGKGDAGSVTIDTGSLEVKNGARISSSNGSGTDAGSVTINATEGERSVTFDGGDDGLLTGAFSQVNNGGKGKAGTIDINTGSLEVKNGAQISSSNGSGTDAGTVTINATEGERSVTFDGVARNKEGEVIRDRDGNIIFSGAFSQVNNGGKGKAGTIDINTGSLEVKNGARISSSNGSGTDAGSVTINATEGERSVTFDGGDDGLLTGAFSQVNNGGKGNAGSVTIDTGSLEVNNGAQISSSNGSGKDAGSVTITATDSVIFNGLDRLINGWQRVTAVRSLVANSGDGNAGNVSINTNDLVVNNYAQINTEVRDGNGNAGNIQIAANRVILDQGEEGLRRENGKIANQGGIISNAENGTGGNINLTLGELLLMRRGSVISANAAGEEEDANGDNTTEEPTGGNINIQSDSSPFEPVVVAVPEEGNSDITANAPEGKGGKIRIDSSGVFGFEQLSGDELKRRLEEEGFKRDDPNGPRRLNSNDITASGGLAEGIIITSLPDFELTEKLLNLPENPIDSSQLVAQGCGDFTEGSESSEFINSGRGGLPPRPDDFTSGDSVWNDTRLRATPTPQKIPNATTGKPAKSAIAPIVPATGWVFNGKGEVTLVSHAKGHSSSFNSDSPNCRVR